MELATLILSIVAALVTAISDAAKAGDWSVLDKPVKELLPAELKTTLARKRAELEAAAKFGATPAPAKAAPPKGKGGETLPTDAAPEHIEQFFAWSHLPPHLAEVSRPFGELAQVIVGTLPRNAERSAALRKLLEAKDAAVRAKVAR